MNEDKTATYYINKRIDKLEETLRQQMDARFDSLEKTLDTHLACCLDTRSIFNTRVSNLEAFKNKVIGIAIVATALLGLVKVTW